MHPAYSYQQLEQIATQLRIDVIKMIEKAGSGHPGGALGMAEMFAALYFSVLKHDPQNPSWDGRDFLFLSNGHTCPILYAALAEAGYFPKEELMTFRKLGTRLQGHPHLGSLPGVENTSGPLGQGLSQAIGTALALKMDKKPNEVLCVMSDGELQEGQNWEALLFAGAKELDNLTILIDRNFIQIDGHTQDIVSLESLENKLRSFNWEVMTINGHDIGAVTTAFHATKAVANGPSAVICNTILGKGVSFMENKLEWHGKPPSEQEAGVAIAELEAHLRELENKFGDEMGERSL